MGSMITNMQTSFRETSPSLGQRSTKKFPPILSRDAIGARVGFPESFQRTAPAPHADMEFSEMSSDMDYFNGPPTASTFNSMPYSEAEERSGMEFQVASRRRPTEPGSQSYPTSSSTTAYEQPETQSHRVSRSSAMRLENILNEVSIGPESYFGTTSNSSQRSRSLSFGGLPVQEQDEMEPTSPVSTGSTVRSLSPEEHLSAMNSKKKKVKMHQCPECNKEFPRPSGLKTHMNMHTKEKPFPCAYPGCMRSFSVVSNAKRHMRTHGIGLLAEECERGVESSPYVVGFEEPVVLDGPKTHMDVDSQKKSGHGRTRSMPFRLRWISGSAISDSEMRKYR